MESMTALAIIFAKKKTKKQSEDPENPWFSGALKGMFRP